MLFVTQTDQGIFPCSDLHAKSPKTSRRGEISIISPQLHHLTLKRSYRTATRSVVRENFSDYQAPDVRAERNRARFVLIIFSFCSCYLAGPRRYHPRRAGRHRGDPLPLPTPGARRPLPLKKSACTAFSLAARSISSPVLPPAWESRR